jgi:hypothetical protein
MLKHKGGEVVKGGFYWDQAQWRLEHVEGTSGALPGGRDARYARVPTVMLFLVAPLMGALFVIFLPFIGFALLLGMIAGRLMKLLGRTPAAAPKPPAEGEMKKAA